jgi:orotate phosphoribosyltransferase
MSSHSSPATKLDARVKAFRKLLELSFKRGKFMLASGKESEFYLDLKPTMFNPEGASLLAQLVLDRIKDLPVDYIGGLELGAVPIVTTVAMLSAPTPRPIPGFFVRKAVKDHGTKRLVEAVNDLTGKNVVILEDVTTTGGSAMQAIAAARAAGANVILVLSVVDRGEGALEFFQQQGIAFQWLFHMQDFIAATE